MFLTEALDLIGWLDKCKIEKMFLAKLENRCSVFFKKKKPYMFFKNPVNQPGSCAWLWLAGDFMERFGFLADVKGTIEIWRPRAFGPENIEILKAPRLDHLHKAKRKKDIMYH